MSLKIESPIPVPPKGEGELNILVIADRNYSSKMYLLLDKKKQREYDNVALTSLLINQSQQMACPEKGGVVLAFFYSEFAYLRLDPIRKGDKVQFTFKSNSDKPILIKGELADANA